MDKLVVLAGRPNTLRYGIAVIATATAVIVRLLLNPFWGFDLPFLTFFFAVMVASWYGGLFPGLVATALSAISAYYFFIAPNHPEGVRFSEVLGLSLFTLTNFIIAFLNERLHRAVRKAETHAVLLEESEQRVRDSQRRKDEFLAILGHELRTPLNGIAASTTALRSNTNDEGGRVRAAEIIERQTQHMSRIISDLLDVSRIGQGKLRLDMRTIDIVGVVEQTSEDFFGSLKMNFNVSLEAPRGPVLVRADRTRVAQILTNLLQNAVKFTNSGGKITVRIQADDGRKDVVVSVIDSGIGIEGELLPHLFDLYTQGNSNPAQVAGLGLGLAIVKSLVELQGGKVEAFSLGKDSGSEVRFILPLLEEASIIPISRETTVLAQPQTPGIKTSSP
jgi:signal transduction histidine kinase